LHILSISSKINGGRQAAITGVLLAENGLNFSSVMFPLGKRTARSLSTPPGTYSKFRTRAADYILPVASQASRFFLLGIFTTLLRISSLFRSTCYKPVDSAAFRTAAAPSLALAGGPAGGRGGCVRRGVAAWRTMPARAPRSFMTERSSELTLDEVERVMI
jgi:hypothetical protein